MSLKSDILGLLLILNLAYCVLGGNFGNNEINNVKREHSKNDGCHIEIMPPSEEAVDYHNYKGWNSVVLVALVDYRKLAHKFNGNRKPKPEYNNTNSDTNASAEEIRKAIAFSLEAWNQDLTDMFKIEGSDQGIQKVNLKCGADSMNIMLETEKPFTGVMYTRGSFYKQSAPCFVKPQGNSARNLEMKFRLDQCQTINDGQLYSNIVVIQNDPELITPGDSAFSVECDFRQPRSLNVESNMQARERNATQNATAASPSSSSQNLIGRTY